MLCSKKFVPTEQRTYNARWGVVFTERMGGSEIGEIHINWNEKLNTKFYANLTNEIHEMWTACKITDEDKTLRDKMLANLSEKFEGVYPGGHLLCGGSSISTCGTTSSDMDLCYVIKTSDVPLGPYGLEIEKYNENKINTFIIDRMNVALSQYKEIKSLESVSANVPIVKFKFNAKKVDPSQASKVFEFDINCNCVAGIYNSYLLGGLAAFDDRLPKLSIVIKRWAKNVKLVDEDYKRRFNSYLIVLLIVHYLQCGVHPPVLPNLMLLQPEDYDGTKEPWNLTTSVDRTRLPSPENRMSGGALLCGFFRYYSNFDFRKYGILIRDASVIELSKHGQIAGMLNSMIFVEEPYDGLTVPKNIKKHPDFEHIMNEFKIADLIMHPGRHRGKMEKPSLKKLLSRELPSGVPTPKEEFEQILSEYT